MSYLAKEQPPIWRRRPQPAYQRPTYEEAKGRLEQILWKLVLLNESAAAGLRGAGARRFSPFTAG